MKIFNPDGAEAKMCGNAAICVSSLIFASKKLIQYLLKQYLVI